MLPIILDLLKIIQQVIYKYLEYYHLNKKNNVGHIYTKEEINIILNRFKKDRAFICAFLTACYTRMRTGEIFSLTWNDIDFNNRIIKINKTVYAKDKKENGR